MCIILTCEPNVRPDFSLIDTCFNNNPDGAGLMWCEDGTVCTEKGFTDVWSLVEAIDSIPKSSRLVVHMRIATSGGIDVGTCHPFPICDDLDMLHSAYTECDAAIAHNGVIAGMPTDDKLGISDTVYFVSHYVNYLYHTEGITKGMQRRIKKAAPNNRFAIMTKDNTVHRIGIGWETVTKGIQASNATWRYDKLWVWDDYDYSSGYEYYEDKFGKSLYDNDLNDWGYRYDGGWGGDGYYDFPGYEYEDDTVYPPAYVSVFDTCCGDDCKHRATCMAFGPMCSYVADIVDGLSEAVEPECAIA